VEEEEVTEIFLVQVSQEDQVVEAVVLKHLLDGQQDLEILLQ
jgi:hypothetical protein